MKQKYGRFLASICCAVTMAASCFPYAAFAQDDIQIPSNVPQEVRQEIEKRFDREGLQQVYSELFNPDLKKENAQIVSAQQAGSVPVALTRLDNGKVAYMVDGKPFYPIAVETGWWDTRVDNNGGVVNGYPGKVGDDFKQVTDEEWNTYFADMASMGFNTVQLMTYWRDWQPTQDGGYDFAFLDHVTGLAAEHGLKTELILFFHSQTDNIPRVMDSFWAYHSDEITAQNGDQYALTMQWGLEGEKLTSAADIRGARDNRPYEGGANGIENFLEYWHPDVFQQLTSALTALGEHYKDSSNIVGYQIGNEEGFNFYVDSGNDKNPYYLELKEQWKENNPQGSENQFRADLIQNLWTCFNNALHKGDPYKPTTTNTQSGAMEKGGWTSQQYTNDGTTLDFYKSVDMVGSMFYGDAASLYPNLDKVYANADGQGYAKGFPILFPTEISATMNGVATQISAQTIARGGQGVGFYCYGELYNDFETKQLQSPKPARDKMVKLVSTLQQIQPYLWSAVPVQKDAQQNVYMQIASVGNAGGTPTLTVMDGQNNRTLGVLHFPGYSNGGGSQFDAEINLTAKTPGQYQLTVYRTDGTSEKQTVVVEDANTPVPVKFVSSAALTTYLAVEPQDGSAETSKLTGIEVTTLPKKTVYGVGEEFDPNGMQVQAVYEDGSKRVLNHSDLAIQLDTSTVGKKQVTVSYTAQEQTFKATFEVEVKKLPYYSNIAAYPGFDNALDLWFDGLIEDPAASGPMKADAQTLEKMAKGEAYVQYNFADLVKVSGVNLWTNYGQQQGIKAFKVEVLNEDGSWNVIAENQAKPFVIDWKDGKGNIEKQSVTFAPVTAQSIRLYITDVGSEWDENGGGIKKFTMREVGFQTTPAPVLKELEITQKPNKTTYRIGDTWDATGLVITAIYSDNSRQDVTAKATVTAPDLSTTGEKQVTVSYQNKTVAFPVQVTQQTVKPTETPTAPPTVAPTVKPTEQPNKGQNQNTTTQKTPIVQTGDSLVGIVVASGLIITAAAAFTFMRKSKG